MILNDRIPIIDGQLTLCKFQEELERVKQQLKQSCLSKRVVVMLWQINVDKEHAPHYLHTYIYIHNIYIYHFLGRGCCPNIPSRVVFFKIWKFVPKKNCFFPPWEGRVLPGAFPWDLSSTPRWREEYAARRDDFAATWRKKLGQSAGFPKISWLEISWNSIILGGDPGTPLAGW